LPVLDPRVPKLIDNASAQSQMSSRDVVAMIERDPGLSATILRVANSPVYRPSGRPVTELEEACVRLGNAQVFTIGAEILIGQSLRCETEPFASLLSALWRNAVVTAHVARHLAGELGLRDLEEVHVTALLHNVGELALVRLLADRDWPEPPTVEALGRELWRSHERFGGSLAKAWRLPERIVRLAASHHRRPMRPELADDRTLRHLVVGAWCVAVRAGFGYAGAEAAGEPAEHLKLIQITRPAIDEAVRMAPHYDPQRNANEESE
jgi:HD-like signal output (HDOD) protein